jgi:hypothetical protein
VHPGFSAASAVVPAPSSPDGSTHALRCAQDFVARDSTGGVRFPGFGVLAGRDDCGGTSGGDGVVALAGIEGTVGCDAGDLLVRRDLVGQPGQRGCITDVAGRELGCADFQSFPVDPDVDLAPDPPLRTAMLAGVPLAFALNLDAPSPVRSNRWRLPARCRPADAAGRPGCDRGMVTFRVLWRRDSVLKSGTAQSRPIRRSRLSTNPVVWRSAIPNNTFIVRQVWTVSSLHPG